MIKVIVFSLDRAMQLSALIESIVKFDKQHLLNVSVVYSYSSADYEKAYELLRGRYPEISWERETRLNKPVFDFSFNFFDLRNWFWWLKYPYLRKKKSNFKQIVLDILEKAEQKAVTFLTDDSFFFKNITISENYLQKIECNPKETSFSLRHGGNVTGGIYTTESAGIYWNVYENDYTTDWGYPFSVDGHVYGKDAVGPILKHVIFNNPNTLEPNVAFYAKQRKLFSNLYASKESCLVGFELNRVQKIINNHSLDISPNKLNDYFLDGYMLHIDFDQGNDFQFRPAIKSINVVKGEEKIVLYSY
jgi:hypothetical protein